MDGSPRSMSDDGLSKALVTLKFFQGKYNEVFKLLEQGSFSDKSGLLEIWDEAHYKEYERKLGRQLTALLRFRIRKRFPPPPHICPNGERPTARLAESACRLLKTWFVEHQQHPYPSKCEKERLSTVCGLSLGQVKTWFANARRRIRLKKSSVAKRPRIQKGFENRGSSDSKEYNAKENKLNSVSIQPEYIDVSEEEREVTVPAREMLVPNVEPVPLDMRCPSSVSELGRMMSLENGHNSVTNWHKTQSFTPIEPLPYGHSISGISTYMNNGTSIPVPRTPAYVNSQHLYNSSSYRIPTHGNNRSIPRTTHVNSPQRGNLHLPVSVSSGAAQTCGRPNFVWSSHVNPKHWVESKHWVSKSPVPCQTSPKSSISSCRWPATSVVDGIHLEERSSPAMSSYSSPSCETGLSRLPPLSPQIFGWSPYTRPNLDPPHNYYFNQPVVNPHPLQITCSTTEGSMFDSQSYMSKHQQWVPDFILAPSSPASCGLGMARVCRQSCVELPQVSSSSFSTYSSPFLRCDGSTDRSPSVLMSSREVSSDVRRLSYQESVNRRLVLSSDQRIGTPPPPPSPAAAARDYKVDDLMYWGSPALTDHLKNIRLPPVAHCWIKPECTVQKGSCLQRSEYKENKLTEIKAEKHSDGMQEIAQALLNLSSNNKLSLSVSTTTTPADKQNNTFSAAPNQS